MDGGHPGGHVVLHALDLGESGCLGEGALQILGRQGLLSQKKYTAASTHYINYRLLLWLIPYHKATNYLLVSDTYPNLDTQNSEFPRGWAPENIYNLRYLQYPLLSCTTVSRQRSQLSGGCRVGLPVVLQGPSDIIQPSTLHCVCV